MFSKKSCLSCAFCLHCRDTFISTLPVTASHWQYDENNLTEEEILKLKKSDFSFLSDAKRKHDEWIEEYKRKEKEYEENIDKQFEKTEKTLTGIGLGIHFKEDDKRLVKAIAKGQSLLSMDPYPMRNVFKMGKCPIAPDHEYLRCWKEIWGEDDKNVWPLLKKKKCSHYYPLSKKETKTLQACDEECKEKKDNKKNRWNNIIAFLIGVITTLLGVILTGYWGDCQKEPNKGAEIMSSQPTQPPKSS